MNNYLLSIDPSIKNTGFTLWENKKPILIESYSFKKNGVLNFESGIFLNNMKDTNMDLIIERGTFHSKNGISY